MTTERIREFFELHYRPGNMVVAVAGDLDHDRVVAGLDAGRRQPGGATPERDAPDGKVEPLPVTRRATEQAHLVLASRSVNRSDPSRYALAVLNHVLGGGLSSRLFQEIRERRGLAYSVWSERVAYHDAGSVSVGMGTAPSTSTRSSTSSPPSSPSWGSAGSPNGSWPSPRGISAPRPSWPARTPEHA